MELDKLFEPFKSDEENQKINFRMECKLTLLLLNLAYKKFDSSDMVAYSTVENDDDKKDK
jgi:hypothetical protein